MANAKAHSPLGASGAYRWMACSGSVALSAGLPDYPNIHAATGTVAHWVGERCLTRGEDPSRFIGTWKTEDGFGIEVDEAMARAVALYVDYVRANREPDGELLVEAAFQLRRLDARLWGTADAVLWQPTARRLVVVDYKNGAGTFVPAKNNPQLRYYALGALLQYGYPAQRVRAVVVQPNCEWSPEEPIRFEELDAVDLLDFAADLKAAVRRVDEKPNEYTPGEHCRFCPAQAICPALAQQAQALAVADFTPPAAYTPERIAECLDWLPRLERWAKAVRDLAYAELHAGRPIPGYKLVEKRGRRVWANEGQALEALKAFQLKAEELYERKLRSPAQLEQALGKAAFAKYLAAHAPMHSTGLTLVPEADKRAAVDPIALDFPADSSA